MFCGAFCHNSVLILPGGLLGAVSYSGVTKPKLKSAATPPSLLLAKECNCSVSFLFPGMTHEDIVQESKKYWQQMEAHASKQTNSVVSKVRLRLGARFSSQWFQPFLSFPPTIVPDRSQADQVGYWDGGELRTFWLQCWCWALCLVLQCYYLLCSLLGWSLQVTEATHMRRVFPVTPCWWEILGQWPQWGPNVSCCPLVAKGR